MNTGWDGFFEWMYVDRNDVLNLHTSGTSGGYRVVANFNHTVDTSLSTAVATSNRHFSTVGTYNYDQLREFFDTALRDANLARTGVPSPLHQWQIMIDAGRNFHHFLTGNGAHIPLNMRRMINFAPADARIGRHFLNNNLNELMTSAERIFTTNSAGFIGTTTRRQMLASPDHPNEYPAGYGRDMNWWFAVGSLHGYIVAYVIHENGNYTAFIQYRGRLMYNWNYDPDSGIGAGGVTDHQMAMLHRNSNRPANSPLRNVREFASTGQYDIVLTWRRGQRMNSGATYRNWNGRLS